MSDYRIRGLSELFVEPTDDQKVAQVTADKSNPKSFAAQLHRTLGSLRLAHVLYDVDLVNKLAAFWPSFSYFHPSRSYGAIKSAPIHLASFLGTDLGPEADHLAVKVKELAANQKIEKSALEQVVSALSDDKAPTTNSSPLAMSVASGLFRGSNWLKKNRENILKIILESPEASYIALASGVWNQDVTLLVDKIVLSPSLTLQLLKSPIMNRQVTESCLKALSGHPVYRVAASCLRANMTDTARAELHQAAQGNIRAASISLGIDPFHSEAEAWWSLAKIDGESLYWLGRAWHASGAPMTDLPRYEEITQRLSIHPQWVYYWCRDLEPHAGTRFVRQIWPSPWAAELIVDLRLPEELVIELVNAQDLSTEALWDSSLILWAADYIKS